MKHPMRHALVLGLGLVLAGACSEEPGTDDSPGGSGGAAGAGMVAGSGGAAGTGMMPMGGTGGAAMPVTDAGSVGGSGGAAGSTSNPNCPTIAPDPVPGQTIVIAAVWIPQRVVYIQNVSNSPVEITTDPPWQWCAFPAYGQIVQTTTTLAPGERLAVSGLDGFSGDVEGAEMAIYSNADFYQEESILAYVIWNQPPVQGRENVASIAGLWTFSDRATVDPGDVGLYATGPTDEGSGYTSVPASCFPLPL